jgi:hypothetical protein
MILLPTVVTCQLYLEISGTLRFRIPLVMRARSPSPPEKRLRAGGHRQEFWTAIINYSLNPKQNGRFT